MGALAGKLAEHGRETVQAFGAETWARRIEDEYVRLLQQPGPRRPGTVKR